MGSDPEDSRQWRDPEAGEGQTWARRIFLPQRISRDLKRSAILLREDEEQTGIDLGSQLWLLRITCTALKHSPPKPSLHAPGQ